MAHRAVFLDRDRTIIADPGFIDDPDVVELLPRAADGVRMLNQADYLAIVVSNQSGIARGLFTEEQLAEVHERLQEMLHEQDAFLDAIYYCPFLPGDEAVVEAYRADSDLRKPNPGMLLQAASDHDVDLQASWMIGDAARDIEAGQRAGCRTILLHAGNDEALIEACQPDFVARSLAEAAQVVLAEVGTSATATTASARDTDRTSDPESTVPPTGARADATHAAPADTRAGASSSNEPPSASAWSEADGPREAPNVMTSRPAPEGEGPNDAPTDAASATIHATDAARSPAPSGIAPSADAPSTDTPSLDEAQNEYDDAVINLLTDIRDGMLRQERAERQEDFSIARLIATVAQVLAVCATIWALTAIFSDSATATARGMLAVLLQLVTLTALVASLRR